MSRRWLVLLTTIATVMVGCAGDRKEDPPAAPPPSAATTLPAPASPKMEETAVTSRRAQSLEMRVTGAADKMQSAPASIAAFGQKPRGGKFIDQFGYDDIRTLAARGYGSDGEGYRHEFATLVKLAQSLTAKAPIARNDESVLR